MADESLPSRDTFAMKGEDRGQRLRLVEAEWNLGPRLRRLPSQAQSRWTHAIKPA